MADSLTISVPAPCGSYAVPLTANGTYHLDAHEKAGKGQRAVVGVIQGILTVPDQIPEPFGPIQLTTVDGSWSHTFVLDQVGVDCSLEARLYKVGSSTAVVITTVSGFDLTT